MEKTVEKRKKFIINFFYFAIIVGVYYLTVKFAFGYIFPFLFAAALAVFLQKPIKKIENLLHIKAHGPLSFILVLLIVLAVVSLLGLASALIFDELKEFASYLFSQFSSLNDVVKTLEEIAVKAVAKLPVSLRDNALNLVEEFIAKLGKDNSEMDLSVLSAPLSGAWVVVKNVPSAFLSFLVTVISCFFMTSDYQNIRSLILSFLSEERGNKLIATKHTVSRGVGKMVKAYATIMLITFSEMVLGLYLLKLLGVYDSGYIAIISFVVCVVDIVPVLGTGTVVIPWAVYSIFFGDVKLGIGLLVLYAVITVIRQIIEPKLVANQAGLPAIATIMAMFIGAKLFGAFGIIILPFTVIILKFMYDEGIFGNKTAFLEKEKTEVTEPVAVQSEEQKND